MRGYAYEADACYPAIYSAEVCNGSPSMAPGAMVGLARPPFWGASYDNNILLSSFADHELVYRDPTGGLSILNMADYTTRILMTNSTFVSRPKAYV